MDPTEQTHTEFEIKRMERAALEALLHRRFLFYDNELTTAIEAYAVAKARAAVAVVREVQAKG